MVCTGIFLAEITSAVLCYQESANASTECGGLDTGTYTATGTFTSLNNISDGDWETYGVVSSTPDVGFYYVNYTKPTNALNSSMWEAKDSSGIVKNFSFWNVTCWNTDADKISLRGVSNTNAPTSSQLQCWDGSDWIETLGQSVGNPNLYEEAMIWNMTEPPSVSLRAPENDTQTLSSSYYFSSNYSGSIQNFTNATLSLWYSNGALSGSNYSTIDSSLNASNMSLSVPSADSFLWGYEICYADFFGDYCVKSINRTISRRTLFENSMTFNTTSYEGLNEAFVLNVTLSSVPTNIKLSYNGTNYTGTASASGEDYILSASLNVPLTIGNKTFYYIWNQGETQMNSSSYGQDITGIIFGLCNATLNKPYINFTFRDESNLSSLNAAVTALTFTYWMGTASFNKTYTFLDNSENLNYAFCFSPSDKAITGNINMQFKSENYPQRTFMSSGLSLSNVTLNQTLYLLKSVDGQYVTFQIINLAEQPLVGVYVNATRTIDSEIVVVGEGTSGADGSVTLWLNPDYSHNFAFQKTGYTLYTTSLFPTQTSYTITLSGGDTSTVNDYTRGISYSIRPRERYLYNSTTYNLNFTLTSSYWDVTEFGFVLALANGTVLGGVSLSDNGGIVALDQATNDYTSIIMNYYYVIDGNYTNSTTTWIIIDSSGTDFSLRNFFNRLSEYFDEGIFGLDRFGLSLIIFLAIFIFTGVMCYKFGISSPVAISLVVFTLVLFFDIGTGLIETPIAAVPHFPTIIIGVIMIGMLIREAYR
jgi:hypothetical protein